MPDSDNELYRRPSRRDFLKTGALGSAVVLAGCPSSGGRQQTSTPTSGGSDGDGSGNDGGGGDGDGNGTGGGNGGTGTPSGGNSSTTVYNKTFTVLDRAGTPPTERHFNPWNTAVSGCWFPGAIVFDRLAVYSPAANKNFPLIAKSWKMPEDTVVEVELSDQWKWHNGDQFVAQDWVMQQQIEKAIARATTDDKNPTIFESIEAVDPTFIRINIRDPLSETFAVRETIGQGQGFLGRGEFVKHDVDKWSTWHKKLRNSSGSKLDSVVKDITTSSFPKISSDKEWIGNGPFQMKSVGDDSIVMERFEGHPEADEINFKEYELWVPANTGQVFQPFANGIVDATPKGFPVQKSLRSQLPKQTELFREALSSNKLFTFNLGHNVKFSSPVNNRNVRKALCHVFDRSQVKTLLQGVKRMFKWPPCRVPGKVLKADSHPSTELVKNKFTKYGQNNTERAAELLRKEGYTRNDRGNWFGPDGKPFQIKVLNASKRPDFQVWMRNMKQFGVLVQQESVGAATFNERRKKGDYDIIPDGSSANGVFAMWNPNLVVSWLMKTLVHIPPTMEIPMPIGDPSGSSGMKEINIPEHINKWMVTGKDKYHHELMWWWNQTVPQMEVMYQPDAGAINTKHWDFSDTPDPIVDGLDDALFVAPKMDQGTLRYKP